MNHIKLAHYNKSGHYSLGGRGKVYINGHEVSGVIAFTPNLLDTNEVASVTITLAVSEFVYGPEAAPAVTMRD